MIVVDCSAMVSALVETPVNTNLMARISDVDLHAPELIDFEVASALRGLCLGRKLSEDQMRDAVNDFSDLIIHRHRMTDLLHPILALRSNFTAYDASYITLADGLDAPLITCDRKLQEAIRLGTKVEVFS